MPSGHTSCSGCFAFTGSILRRFLRPVNHQNLHRPLGRFQLQPELFLEDREDGRQRLILSGRSKKRRERQDEIVFPLQSRPIENRGSYGAAVGVLRRTSESGILASSLPRRTAAAIQDPERSGLVGKGLPIHSRAGFDPHGRE